MTIEFLFKPSSCQDEKQQFSRIADILELEKEGEEEEGGRRRKRRREGSLTKKEGGRGEEKAP